jgi:hypothetical protein
MAETITFREGVLEALFEEMRAAPSVILMGEDVGAAGGVFQQTKGLFEEFGARRIIDTPISESGAFGMAIGEGTERQLSCCVITARGPELSEHETTWLTADSFVFSTAPLSGASPSSSSPLTRPTLAPTTTA